MIVLPHKINFILSFPMNMCSCNFTSLILVIIMKIATKTVGLHTTRVESKFRILAPEFICPKDENAIVEKPDNTVITVQAAADADLRIEWTVRWSELSPAPSQRFTLMLWRTVRQLEKQLNRPPPEPYVYIIDNSELLPGVNYTFNVISIESNGEISEPQSFHIDNTQGDPKLMIEGRNEMLSVVLIGAQMTYVDVMFIVDAQITTCQPTQEYYFTWTVQSLDLNDFVDVSQVQGSRLQVPPCVLKAGSIYTVTCQVMRYYTGDLITRTSLPFSVQYRGLEAYLSVDHLVVTKNIPFTLELIVVSHDYCNTAPATFDCKCTHKNESCNNDVTRDKENISFPFGLTNIGEYFITVTIKVLNQTTTVNATINVVEPSLPLIQLSPLSRVLNEGSMISVIANATNLTPACTLSWYFANKEYLASLNSVTSNNTWDEYQHGEAQSETLTIHSLEEQFLNELTDFSNDTEWRQVTATLPAASGRARFVVHCGCSLAFNCHSMGTVYADIWFQINGKPTSKDLIITPDTGTALETIFRLSTLVAIDPDMPLQYTFFCTAGNDTILLGSYVEHRAIETFLPYVDSGIEVWVQVCDVFGACTKSNPRPMTLDPGEGRTIDALISAAAGNARRCELTNLMNIIQSAVITYTNTRKLEALTKFYQSLEKALSRVDKNNCVILNYEQYSEILFWLANHGVETKDVLHNN